MTAIVAESPRSVSTPGSRHFAPLPRGLFARSFRITFLRCHLTVSGPVAACARFPCSIPGIQRAQYLDFAFGQEGKGFARRRGISALERRIAARRFGLFQEREKRARGIGLAAEILHRADPRDIEHVDNRPAEPDACRMVEEAHRFEFDHLVAAAAELRQDVEQRRGRAQFGIVGIGREAEAAARQPSSGAGGRRWRSPHKPAFRRAGQRRAPAPRAGRVPRLLPRRSRRRSRHRSSGAAGAARARRCTSLSTAPIRARRRPVRRGRSATRPCRPRPCSRPHGWRRGKPGSTRPERRFSRAQAARWRRGRRRAPCRRVRSSSAPARRRSARRRGSESGQGRRPSRSTRSASANCPPARATVPPSVQMASANGRSSGCPAPRSNSGRTASCTRPNRPRFKAPCASTVRIIATAKSESPSGDPSNWSHISTTSTGRSSP